MDAEVRIIYGIVGIIRLLAGNSKVLLFTECIYTINMIGMDMFQIKIYAVINGMQIEDKMHHEAESQMLHYALMYTYVVVSGDVRLDFLIF